jgi:hypothetical protein
MQGFKDFKQPKNLIFLLYQPKFIQIWPSEQLLLSEGLIKKSILSKNNLSYKGGV